MAEPATLETIPLVTGSDGVIRVSGTRVPLETIVAPFRDGATPEEMAEQYRSVPLADIYHLIGYYLRHAEELEPYLNRRLVEGEQTRRQNEARWKPEGIRQRLLSRRRN